MTAAALDISVTVNGRPHRLSVAPRRILADVLREDLQLTGCKIGCTVWPAIMLNATSAPTVRSPLMTE